MFAYSRSVIKDKDQDVLNIRIGCKYIQSEINRSEKIEFTEQEIMNVIDFMGCCSHMIIEDIRRVLKNQREINSLK